MNWDFSDALNAFLFGNLHARRKEDAAILDMETVNWMTRPSMPQHTRTNDCLLNNDHLPTKRYDTHS